MLKKAFLFFHDFTKLRGLKIIHQNIQILGAKVDQLRLLVRELKSGIHVLTLIETWLKQELATENTIYRATDFIERIEMEIIVELRCTHVKIYLLQGERT